MKELFPLEPPFNSPEFEEAWAGFMDMRHKTKHPLTMYAVKILFRQFAKFPEQSVIDALEKSTINNWRGVFPEQNNFQSEYEKAAQRTRELTTKRR